MKKLRVIVIFTYYIFSNVGSSETTCEIDNNNIYLKDEFKYWFIGFTEGDGNFSVYKDKYLEFKIIQWCTNIYINN